MKKIIPHLWFDKEAEEAAQLYMSLFEDAKLIDKTILQDTPSGAVDMLTIELAGQEFMLLSAGPYFKFTPAVSFLIACSTADEVDDIWNKLMEGGEALMPLDSYPFSPRYGWAMDRYGLSWQVMYADKVSVVQKITPTMMFTGDQWGNAEEAMNFYTEVFRDSKTDYIFRYGENVAPDKPGTIQHAEFTLEKQLFAAMDSAGEHGGFNEAISFLVNCDTQEEIDYYWNKLSAVPEAEQCGWLKDKYGFSWQVSPTIMHELMRDKDPEKLARVTEAFLKMKKFDIAELMRACDGI